VSYHRFDWEARCLLVLAAIIFVAGGFWAGRVTAPEVGCGAHHVYVVDSGRCVAATDHAAHMEGS
jgi:hypothetical protein